MTAKISILIPSRSNVNGIDRFKNCISSIINTASNYENFEILIKIDEDEPKKDEYLTFFEDIKKSGVNLNYIITSGAKGYKSIHEFYMDLVLISSTDTQMYFGVCDDAEFTHKGWDDLLIKTAEKSKSELFVIHPTVYYTLNDKDIHQALQHVEAFPIWSREWIHTQGCVGYSFSTDGWTSAVEYNLYRKYGIDNRIELTYPIISRHERGGDNVGSDRWNNVRKEVLKFHLGEKMLQILESTTDKLALKIIQGTEVSERIKDKYVNDLKEMMLKLYDEKLQYKIQNFSENNWIDLITKNKKSVIVNQLKDRLKARNSSRNMVKFKTMIIKLLLRLQQIILK